jgi:alpha-beta hydrolase superfamily lysophospholipase
MPIYWFIALTVALFVLISLAISCIFSNIILYSRRQPVVRTPMEHGMEYQDVEFKSTDGLTLKGWFIPAASDGEQDKAIILTHPMPFNRHGFIAKNQGFPPLFKTDVDLLTTAHALHQAGYSVLTFDLRNHGESERGMTGNGLTEYQDVLGAVEYISNQPSLSSPQIGFVSFCMGAASTMVALSKGKDQLNNIKFLIAIQPISADIFFRCYMRAVYTPLSLYLIPIVDRLVQWRGGFAFEEMSPLPFARDIEIPTLYIQAKDDPWTELRDIESFYEATAGPKELWLIEGITRRFEAYNYVGQHPDRILEFVGQHFETR